jgi:hypothetical protein
MNGHNCQQFYWGKENKKIIPLPQNQSITRISILCCLFAGSSNLGMDVYTFVAIIIVKSCQYTLPSLQNTFEHEGG